MQRKEKFSSLKEETGNEKNDNNYNDDISMAFEKKKTKKLKKNKRRKEKAMMMPEYSGGHGMEMNDGVYGDNYGGYNDQYDGYPGHDDQYDNYGSVQFTNFSYG